MREILFKARKLTDSERLGEWVQGLPFKHGDYECYCIAETEICGSGFNSEIAGIWFPVDEDTICQYTGLTDKNGKKIFEGDKLNVWGGTMFETEAFVFFNNGTWSVRFEKFKGRQDNLHWIKEHTEVIGSIHD